MNNKGLTKHLLIYEIRNVTGNAGTVFFGIIFPLLMSILFANVIAVQIPESRRMDVRTGIFLSMIMMIPMATMFIGYAVTYSQENDNSIPLRLDLFGIKKRSVLAAKLSANLIFLLASTTVYFAVDLPLIKINLPSVSALLLLILVVILLGSLLLVIAHSIAGIAGKFSRTYTITMILYFGFMVLCGMMGIQISQFPPFIQTIAKLFPMTYMSTGADFLLLWKGEKYNPVNFVLSFVSLAMVAMILFLLSLWKNRRAKNQN